MNAQEILEQLLQSGREMVNQGQEIAEEKLNIPKEGEERDAALAGMGKGALAAGGLAILLGTGAGRRLTGGAFKLGGLAAVGTLAYQTYTKWQQENAGNDTLLEEGQNAADKLTGEKAEQRSQLLIKAMVSAAKADGHIDAAEQAKITQQINQLQLDEAATQFIVGELEQAVDPQQIADEADSTATAAEVYLVSRAVIDVDNEKELAYLEKLAKALALPPELVEKLNEKLVE